MLEGSRPFSVKLADISPAEFKTLLVGTSSPFITPQRDPYVSQVHRPTSVLDLVTVGQASTDSIEFARQQSFVNVAAETVEGTTTTTGTKPEATLSFEKVTAIVKTIAHWLPTTRRALQDVAQLQTVIDSELRYGVQLRLENQIVAGDGTGENLTGILNTANILTQAKGADTNEDALAKAATQLRVGNIAPTGIVMHPTNYQTIRLAKASGSGEYLLGAPGEAMGAMLWGLPLVTSTAVPLGTALVADWARATLWIRSAVQVLVSDSHSDYFTRNLVAILSEGRFAAAVTLPGGFCKVTGLS